MLAMLLDSHAHHCANISQCVLTLTSGGLDMLPVSPAEELGPGLPDMRGSLPGLGRGRFACALHTMLVHLCDSLHALNIATTQGVCCKLRRKAERRL